MTWPMEELSPQSPAQVWRALVSQARTARIAVFSARQAAEAGRLTAADLRRLLPQVRGARATQADLDGTAGLQQFARLALADPAFDLSIESNALKAAYGNVISEARALHNLAAGRIDADGAVVEPMDRIPADQAAAFIAACQALEAAIA